MRGNPGHVHLRTQRRAAADDVDVDGYCDWRACVKALDVVRPRSRLGEQNEGGGGYDPIGGSKGSTLSIELGRFLREATLCQLSLDTSPRDSTIAGRCRITFVVRVAGSEAGVRHGALDMAKLSCASSRGRVREGCHYAPPPPSYVRHYALSRLRERALLLPVGDTCKCFVDL